MWFSNFEIVLRNEVIPNGAVLAEDGVIVEVRNFPVAAPDVFGNGKLLLPGFIDIHTDAIEREVEPRKGAYNPLKLAVQETDRKFAASGITTAYSALSFIEKNAYGYDLDEQRTATICGIRGSLPVDHRIHVRFEKTFSRALSIVQGLVREGHVDLLSLMDHTPGQDQFRDIERHILDLMSNNLTREQAIDTFERRLKDLAMTTVSEEIQAALAAYALARGTIIASHDDDTVEKVHLAKTLGARISEFPITLLRAIPPGEAWSYGALAAKLGSPNASRAVGLANSLNPVNLFVPCHRVIGSSGALTGYGGGIERMRWLLAHERGSASLSAHQLPLFPLL